ncbi:hypothetical protein F5Y09DRAFT_338528 [Xylaria sp. FL1042]|nr:hypothetical protein F5Y09DRAFT_338528 [Xylaria sp. FL1042]
MSAGINMPSFGESEAKSNVQLTNDDRKAENNSTGGVEGKLDLEKPVEVDADLKAEDDSGISQIPAEVRCVVNLHDDSIHS